MAWSDLARAFDAVAPGERRARERELGRRSIGAVMVALAGGLVLHRALTGRWPGLGPGAAERRYAADDALVDEASDDSFPASDPPSFTPASGTGAPPEAEREP